jgi:hypothetical protein
MRTLMTHMYVVLVLAALLCSARANAQANFNESFDVVGATGPLGPSALRSRGWTFRNQSSPVGPQSWYQGFTPDIHPDYPSPQSGAGYVSVSAAYSSDQGGTMSDWAILPVVPNQIAGDQLRFWVLGSFSDHVNTMQVRYSPTGAIGTGSGPTGIGDFTTLLLDLNPVPGPGWNLVTVTLPGNGRIALRAYAPQACAFCSLGFIGVDSLSVGPPPPPVCNMPPVPGIGQSVTWTTAGSPYRMCQNMSIPAGSTVTVQPGVVVNFDADRSISVVGTLRLQGTATQRILLNGTVVFPPTITVDGGRIESANTDFRGQMRVNSGSTLDLNTSTFSTANTALIVQELQSVMPFVRLAGCTFTNTQVAISDALLVMQNNTFIGANPRVYRGYVDITATNTFTGCALELYRERIVQPMLIDGIHASGSPVSGLILQGGDYHVGPNTVLTNNQFPIRVLGGLTRDSTLPTTGNTNNAIDVGGCSFQGEGTWPNLGLTYRLTEEGIDSPGGDLVIDPGVVVEAAHSAAWIRFRSVRYGRLLGLPGNPITFRGRNNQLWRGLRFALNTDTGTRLEHCVIEDAQYGINATDTWNYVDSCLVRDSQVGAGTNTFGVLQFAKTRFTNNAVGLDYTALGTHFLNNLSTPNSISGNASGVNALDGQANLEDFMNVWWGNASGPTIASNPGGTGDSIAGVGAPAVLYSPFLGAAPDAANHPPVVRLTAPGLTHVTLSTDSSSPDFLLEAGSKYILRWTVDSDDAITSQRVEFSPDAPIPDRYVVVADNIAPDVRSIELTIPDAGFALSGGQQFFRLIVTDAAGQKGFDHVPVSVPSNRLTGQLNITTNLTGQTFIGGASTPPTMQWTGVIDGLPTHLPQIVLESDGYAIQGLEIGGAGQFFEKFPMVSTDRARLAIMTRINSNDIKWTFAPGYFSIRHDPRLGLVPPTVSITSPTAAQAFAGATTIPITWTATSAEGLRSFDIMASYDSGRTWHVVVRDLPAAARSYNWALPPSTGIPGVGLRVVARDSRFQNSASDVAIAITPGTGGCPADLDNGSGTGTPDDAVDINDLLYFLVVFENGSEDADLDNDGDPAVGTPDGGVDINDLLFFLARFEMGC